MPFLAPVAGIVGGILGSTIGKMVVGIGLNLIMGQIQKKKAKKDQQQQQQVGGVDFDRQYGENVSRKVLCGPFAIAGHDCYVNTYGEANKYLEQVFVLSDYPCLSLNKIWAGGIPLDLSSSDGVNFSVASGEYAGIMSFVFYNGEQSAANGGLISNSNPNGRWTSDHIGHGMCYIIVRMTYDQERLSQFPDFFFEGRGAKLYDIRKDSTMGGVGPQRWNNYSTHEYSDNPIVVDYNYRRGFKWSNDLFCGMGMADSDLPPERYISAMNICDESAGYGKRYTCMVALDCMAQHGDNIDSIMRSCGGVVIDTTEGSWPLVGAGQDIVETFTDDDLVRNEPVRFQRYHSMGNLVNSVSGVYYEPSNIWSPTGYDTQTDATYVAIDRRTLDISLDFPMVYVKGQANQLASIYFKENRHEPSADVVLRPRFQTIKAGDWIYWDSEVEYRKGIYMVQARSISALDSDGPRNVALSLVSRSADIYDTVGVIPPTVPLPNGMPIYLNELQDYAVLAVLGVGADGRSYPAFRLSWAAINDTSVTGIEIQWWPHEAPDDVFSRILEPTNTITFIQEGILSLTEYDFRYRLLSDVRPTFWTEVLTVKSVDGGGGVEVGLAELKKDAIDQLKNMESNMNRLWRRVEEITIATSLNGAIGEIARERISADLGTAHASVTQERIVRIRENDAMAQDITVVQANVGEVAASVVTEATARATADSALATAITGVQAEIGEVLADGYLAFTASLNPDESLSKIEMAARLEKGGEVGTAALILKAQEVGGDIKSEISLVANSVKFVDADGENGQSVVAFEDGAMKLAVANIGTVNAGMIQSTNGKMQINVNAGTIIIRS
jgi:hypothetical protein